MTSPDGSPPGPLDGVRVLDFTMNLPGPYATLLLSAMGAEVIKVEPPRGDTARHIGRLFQLVNAGKKSVAVDLKTEDGRRQLAPLLATADVLIEGFRPGVMEGLGLGADTVRTEHPRLVYCSVSGFGQSGPYRDYPAHDLNLQAITGVCHLMRDADDHPWGCALPIADLSSGLAAATTICAALFARERSGEGRAIDVALCDTVLSWAYLWREGLAPGEIRGSTMVGPVKQWLAEAERAPKAIVERLTRFLDAPATATQLDRVGTALMGTRRYGQLSRLLLHALPHYGVFETADGRWLSIGIVDEGKFWRALCEGLGLPSVLGSLSGGARIIAGGPLRRIVANALQRRSADEWMRCFDRANVPVTPVLPVAEALRDPQLATRIHGIDGAGVPASFVPPIPTDVSKPAPRLGEHNPHLLGG